MRKYIIAILAISCFAVPLSLWAQPHPQWQKHREQRRQEVEERIQTMKIWKMTEELQLDKDQAARFFPLLNELERNMDKIEMVRHENVRELSEIVWNTEADEKKITELLNTLDSFDEQQMKLRQDFRKEASKILKPDQVGRMVLFNMRFPDVVRDLVREFQEDGPRPMPPEEKRGFRP
ncbi:MAG: hypothetical protein ABH878_04630 [bacterium]